MRAPTSIRPVDPSLVATAVRRSSGPVADQLFVLCRSLDGASDVTLQAERVYEALKTTLGAAGASPGTVVTETVYLRQVADAAAIRTVRDRVVAQGGYLPATTMIGQAPLDAARAALAIAAVAVVPRDGTGGASSPLTGATTCSCAACASGTGARVLRIGAQTALWTGNIYGTGADAFAEAYDMFCVAERLLAEAGMTFADVMRTWIHLRDIDRDYDALNRARRAFFQERGITRRPASTGVQGIPVPDGHDVSVSLYALRSDPSVEVTRMSTPSLNEAWSYGADFSRGLRVTEANQNALYVSGTASLDETGRTVHVGDFPAQVDRMLHNITTLLDGQAAGVSDLVSLLAYVKHAGDAPALDAQLRTHGFGGVPYVIVEAPLCRPELLCEAEAVAVLPLATTGA